MKRTAHLAGFAVLLALGAVPVFGAAAASVSGYVRDSSGVPQIGAEVQLLRSDLTVITSVYTNDAGQFVIASVLPGRYAVKAMGQTFLPSLRENVRVRRGTVVNLTLNTLYEVMQWLPSQPRPGTAQSDDWTWTLRSAANRPLLRWLEDGPLMVVSDGTGTQPRLKARLMATGQAGTFGESGERFASAVEDTPSDSQELLARVDFSHDSNAGIESMLGFRQDLGFAGSVQSVAAVAIHPEEVDGAGDGLQEAALHTEETIHVGPDIEAEAGTTEVMGRFAGQQADTLAVGLPFATVSWHDGNTAVHYGMATMVPARGIPGDAHAEQWLPRFAEQNGNLVIERGMHQEIGWERGTDRSRMAVVVFADRMNDPILEAMTRSMAQPSSNFAASGQVSSVLFDTVSGMVRGAGPDFSTAGMEAELERTLPGGNHVRLTYANGSALVMQSAPNPTGLAQIFAAARPHRAQAYSISLSGTLDGTGTRWQASYRWQADDTVMDVAPFAVNAAAPYLNLHIRQPIHTARAGATSVDALFDAQNLLAQGYHPYLLSDGSLVIFAQDQRGFRGGLAFTF